jgi:hypothetical protein
MREVMTRNPERGVALVMALMATTMMLTLGGALVLLSSSETVIAANFRAAHEAAYAADAAVERALADLRSVPDWTTVLNGGAVSSFVDGVPSGSRTLIDGSSVDLDQATNLANCEKPTACTATDIAATTTDRPWGANNPRWALYAYGPLAESLGTTAVHSGFYVMAFVGDDPSENDSDPMLDGFSLAGDPNPGTGIIVIRAEAFGPRNAHRVVEATIARLEIRPEPGEPAFTELRILSWREVF